jgi:hypothetical protein
MLVSLIDGTGFTHHRNDIEVFQEWLERLPCAGQNRASGGFPALKVTRLKVIYIDLCYYFHVIELVNGAIWMDDALSTPGPRPDLHKVVTEINDTRILS